MNQRLELDRAFNVSERHDRLHPLLARQNSAQAAAVEERRKQLARERLGVDEVHLAPSIGYIALSSETNDPSADTSSNP